jgi:nucleoside-diphosphate-sugar epimerase
MQWDFVVNLAAETALGKRDDFYQKAVDGAAKSGALAAGLAAGGGGTGRLKKYVFVSSASVYEPTAAASREDAPLAPWTAVAESMLRCERALAAVPGLPLVVLRPALVYGPGDFGSLMPRCVVAASYQRAGERMELLWDGSAKLRRVRARVRARARRCLSKPLTFLSPPPVSQHRSRLRRGARHRARRAQAALRLGLQPRRQG